MRGGVCSVHGMALSVCQTPYQQSPLPPFLSVSLLHCYFLLLRSFLLFFFSLHVLLQNYNRVQPAVKYASVSGWDLCKSSFSDSWFFFFFFCIRQLKSEDYTALMGCECSVFLWIRKSLRKHIWVKWKKNMIISHSFKLGRFGHIIARQSRKTYTHSLLK